MTYVLSGSVTVNMQDGQAFTLDSSAFREEESVAGRNVGNGDVQDEVLLVAAPSVDSDGAAPFEQVEVQLTRLNSGRWEIRSVEMTPSKVAATLDDELDVEDVPGVEDD